MSTFPRFLILFFKIPFYRSSADFSGWFLLKGKSRKTFDIIVSTQLFFLISIFFGGGGAVVLQQSPPSQVRTELNTQHLFAALENDGIDGNRSRLHKLLQSFFHAFMHAAILQSWDGWHYNA